MESLEHEAEEPVSIVSPTQDEGGVNFLETATVSDEDMRAKSALEFKSRLRSFAYSPAKGATQPSTIQNSAGHLKPHLTPGTPSPRKRRASETASTSPTPKRSLSRSASRSATRTANRRKDPYSPVNHLVDALRPGLQLVFIGLNPGLMTAETGHAYAHPSNLFWKLLHSSGITDYRHPPSDTYALQEIYGIGNTNICARPTRDGSGLSKQELEDGVPILEEKMRRFRPDVACIVGKGIWDTIYRVRFGGGKKVQGKEEFRYGWQDRAMWLGREVNEETGEVIWEGTRTFVATTTSGLAAGMRPAEKEAVWKELGDWIVAKRKDTR